MSKLILDKNELGELVREVIAEIFPGLDWPTGRLTLTEEEAANACGVGRHVLRDLRLAGRLKGHRLGKRVVYSRDNILEFLASRPEAAESKDRSSFRKRSVAGGAP